MDTELTPANGLVLLAGSSPYTSETLAGAPALVDDDLYGDTGLAESLYAEYGIDLGSVQAVDYLTVRCLTRWSDLSTPAPTPASWNGTNTFKLFKSDDNSAWTFIEDVVNPAFTHAASGELAFKLGFTTQQTARYFKLVRVDDAFSLTYS